MKLIKSFLAAIVAVALSATTFTSCTDYQDEIDSLDTRVTALEKLTADMNTNLSSLSSIVSAMNAGDYITNVTTTEDGYIITFAKAGAITIKNGKDGADASTPDIVPVKDSDGNYYWQLNGEWMLDGDGNKVRANGLDGADAVSPQVRINPSTNVWEVSTDGGTTWTSTGVNATGNDGADAVSVIKSVTEDANYVTITLSDDSTIQIPKTATSAEAIDLKIDESGTEYVTYMLPGQIGTFTLDKIGLSASEISKVLVDEGCEVKIEGEVVTITRDMNWRSRVVMRVLTISDDMKSLRIAAPDLYILANGTLPQRLMSNNPVASVMAGQWNKYNISFGYNTEWVDLEKENDCQYMYSIMGGLSSKYFSDFKIEEIEITVAEESRPEQAAAALAGTTVTKIGDTYIINTEFDDSMLTIHTGAFDESIYYKIRYTISITRIDGTVLKGAWTNVVIRD